MKVICKCCLRPFDYDMYMGLCPKCGRVYRREKGMYSEVEKDMVGDFHLHADDGGLNRGIDGVVYNQPGSVAEKNTKNGFDEDYMDRHFRSASRVSNNKPANNKPVNNKPANTAPANNRPANNKPEVHVDRAALIERQKQSSGGYYAPNHKTQMNKEVMKTKKKGSGLGVIIWIIMIIIGYLIANK